MVSDTIRKKVDEIQGQATKRLQEVVIIVLLFTITAFYCAWFGQFIILRAYYSGHVEWVLYNDLTVTIVSFVFLIGIVSYFWRLRSKSEFRVLFIERKQEQEQSNTKHFSTLALISVGVIIGLMFTWISYVLLSFGIWQSFVYALWWPLERTPLSVYPLIVMESTKILEDFLSLHNTSVYHLQTGQYPLTVGHIFYPVIVVICSSIFFYVGYLIKPERVKRSIPWLLGIGLIVIIFSLLYGILCDILRWYELLPWPWGSIGLLPSIRGFMFIDNVSVISGSLLFIGSSIVLLYITYHINIRRERVTTYIKGEPLQGLIEEAVWVLPEEVRENDSHLAWLELKLSEDFMKRGLDVNKRGPRESSLYTSSDYLEAELEGVGLTVGGEKQMKIHEISPLLVTTWSCSFAKHGIHTVNLRLSVVKPTDKTKQLLFIQDHTVHVDSFLTISWAPIFAIVGPILVVVVQVLLRGGR